MRASQEKAAYKISEETRQGSRQDKAADKTKQQTRQGRQDKTKQETRQSSRQDKRRQGKTVPCVACCWSTWMAVLLAGSGCWALAVGILGGGWGGGLRASQEKAADKISE